MLQLGKAHRKTCADFGVPVLRDLHRRCPGLFAKHWSVENGVLSITGEKRAEVREGEEGGDFHLVERRYGRFERRFTLPRSVDAEKVSAEFRDGLLTVTLPKAEAAKPRRIEVKAIAK